MIDRFDFKNRSRYTVITNGCETVVIDTWRRRYDHMRRRVVAWARAMSDCKAEYKMITLTYDVKGTKRKARNWEPNDIRDFQLKLRAWLHANCQAIKILGYCWVAEVQPTSKNYHYHFILASDKKIHFNKSIIQTMWPWGFIKLSVARSPYYIVSYMKKQDQKDYWYFPYGARGFAPYVNNELVMSNGCNVRTWLRFRNLKVWQLKFIADAGSIEEGFVKMRGQKPPPSGWVWIGSCATSGYADYLVEELKKKDFQAVHP